MSQDLMNLPLRNGVGIMVINKEKKVFVGKRIDNQESVANASKVVLIIMKTLSQRL